MFESINNINDIIKHFASLDDSGQSQTKIDTKQEYEALGNYLNGQSYFLSDENDNIYETNYVNLSSKDKQILFKIMDGLKSKFGEWNNIFADKKEVTKDNYKNYVNRLIEFQNKLNDIENEQERKEYYNDIKKELAKTEAKLKKYCEKYGISTDFTENNLYQIRKDLIVVEKEENIKELGKTVDEDFKVTTENAKKYLVVLEHVANKDNKQLIPEKISDIIKKAYVEFLKIELDDITTENLDKFDLYFALDMATQKHQKNETMKKCGQKIQETIDNPYDNSKLKAKAEQYIKDNNIPKLKDIPDNVDIGNGKFDKTSTQKTENCWLHAGINSLLSTDKGKQIIESNYYRDETTGIIAIHIPEAEQFGLHDGIFYVTPQEIVDSQDTLASGEGEISAYIIAIQKYFKEVSSNPELKERIGEERNFTDMDTGNYGFRFYELMTGGMYTEFKYDSDVKIGIGTSTHFDANKLYEMVEQKQGAIVISLRGAQHAISIIGVKDGNFIIQESNNDTHFFDKHIGANGEKLFLPTDSVNNRPTFAISEKTIDEYDLGALSYIMWN